MTTHLQELTDLKLKAATGHGLFSWIAWYRQPGENWLNWEAMARKQYDVTGSWIHRPSLRDWSDKAGIPDTRNPGRRGTVEDTLAFRKAVTDLGIVMPIGEPVKLPVMVEPFAPTP